MGVTRSEWVVDKSKQLEDLQVFKQNLDENLKSVLQQFEPEWNLDAASIKNKIIENEMMEIGTIKSIPAWTINEYRTCKICYDTI